VVEADGLENRYTRKGIVGSNPTLSANRAASLAALILLSWGTVAAQDFAGREKLRAHGEQEFRKDVIKVTDGVYVAVGYSMANATLIVGDGGTIIVDTTTKLDDAQAVRAEFAKISRAPVRAIIYTHSHPDHTGGASVFAGTDRPEIYSHQLFVDRVPDLGRAGRDGGDQFGSTLPDALYINGGTGTEFGRPSGPAAMKTGPLPPTRTFSGALMSLTIAGVRMDLLHTPGETSDGLSVWLPEKRVLLTGDLFLKAFPNLYAIRGAAPRPVQPWVDSLTMLIALGPEYLVPGHTRPVSGAANAREALTTYRDGIKSVFDQTLEGMKRGLRPDELVQQVKLPPHLAESPYLQEYYGTVEWSVRAIYSDHLGWFDGNPTHLFPLPEKDRAQKVVALAGGVPKILSSARDALANAEFRWAAELTDFVLAVDAANVDAKRLKAQALTELGERQTSANARNYYLSVAQFLRRDLPPH
jgi:alkyl sulfatase BDS1-like metallo-beta-lactamase superfamily hydrolase